MDKIKRTQRTPKLFVHLYFLSLYLFRVLINMFLWYVYFDTKFNDPTTDYRSSKNKIEVKLNKE